MSRLHTKLSRLAFGCTCALLLSSGVAAACEPLMASWDALQARDLDTLQSQSEAAKTAPSCGSEHQVQINRWLAEGLRIKALSEADSLTAARPDLEAALSAARPWSLLATLGDAAREAKEFDVAAQYFQDAMADILVVMNPSSPYWEPKPGDDIRFRIKQKSDEMRLAATTFVTRSGRPACQIQSLGMWGTQIVTPIRFVTAQSTFSAPGTEAAEELFQCLSALDPDTVREIRIIGHTDPRGTDSYNQTLSEGRAQAVQAFLEDRGLALPLVTEGRGETDPFRPDDPEFYSTDELHQMNRRVEVDVVTYE